MTIRITNELRLKELRIAGIIREGIKVFVMYECVWHPANNSWIYSKAYNYALPKEDCDVIEPPQQMSKRIDNQNSLMI